MARTLLGSVVTFGIDAIVSTIRALHLGATAETAKTEEKAMAIAGLLVTGAIAGAVLFALLRKFRGNYAYLFGIVIGEAVGAPVTFISRGVSQTATTGPIISAIWILAAFLIWGAALGWSYRQLSAVSATEVAKIGRRRFLIRLGGVTAVIAIASTVVGNLAVRRRCEVVEGERWSATHALPNAAAEVKSAPGT